MSGSRTPGDDGEWLSPFMLVMLALLVVITAILVAFAMGTGTQDKQSERVTVVSKDTDRPGVVCFFRLDNNHQVQDMACVYTGED